HLAVQAEAYACVVVDVDEGEVLVGGIPDLRRHLPAPGVRLEPLLVAGPVEEEEAGAGEAHTVAPDGRQPLRRFVHELTQIALPAPVEVAEEEQPAAAVDD